MNSNPALAHISEDKARAQTVYEHLSGTADLAGEFAAPFGATEEARFAGWLHDIGKYSTAFQKRLLEDGPRVDHATAGAREAMHCRTAVSVCSEVSISWRITTSAIRISCWAAL